MVQDNERNCDGSQSVQFRAIENFRRGKIMLALHLDISPLVEVTASNAAYAKEER